MTKTFPTLYKNSNTNKIQEWTIFVDNSTITIVHGQKDGKLQATSDTIKEGKNLGKTNATTAQEQALSEAESKYTKQLKKGYVESLEAALKGETDSIIEGGIAPMLSINKSYPKDPILDKYLKYPCIVQPKLDGACCIAIVKDGKATLWSRTRKAINCVPHIVKQLEERFPEGSVILHGELYEHDTYKDRFEDLMSIIRKDEPDSEELYKDIQLHVYDMPSLDIPNFRGINESSSYRDRFDTYSEVLNIKNVLMEGITSIIPVIGFLSNNRDHVIRYYNDFLEAGYEGAMAKNISALYESGKRSSNILKMKEFTDSECEVIGIEEGRGKEANAVGAFVCKWCDNSPSGADKDAIFKVRMKCTLKQKQDFFKTNYVGKILTFTYKRITAEGKPYIPVGKGFSLDKQKV